MPAFKQYDPLRLVFTFKGFEISGYASGTMIKVERTADSFTMVAGGQGDVTRVANRDRTGSFTLTLQQAMPSNGVLSGVLESDELNLDGVGEAQLKDLNGNTIYHAESAWIRKPPDGEYAQEATNREWIIDCAFIEMHMTGN